MSDGIISDDVFENYAREQEEAAKAANSNSGSSGGVAYENIQWTGLETNRMKIVRAVGGPPDSNIDKFTARTCRIARIVGDDGRQFRCILPERADDPGHLLWRIITRVNAVDWKNGEKIFPVQEKHPDIYNIINHNGYDPKDKRFIYDRGWVGRQALIMNVIDREQMDWHRANKHTMLLSRSIGEGKDGTKFPEEGVPVYGFASLLANLFKYYKSWEKYDLGITRTGLKEVPYKVINAVKYIEEVPDYLKKLVVSGPLTEEELSWERYDLQKLFAITRYTKIYNKLKLTIARIDAVLGTRYLKELEDLVAKEKEELEKQREESESPKEHDAEAPEVRTVGRPSTLFSSASEAQAQQATPPTAIRERFPVAQKPSFDTSWLLGWEKLKPAEQNIIEGIVVKNGKLIDIKYSDPNATLLACPVCKIPAPDTFMTCPCCGASFA